MKHNLLIVCLIASLLHPVNAGEGKAERWAKRLSESSTLLKRGEFEAPFRIASRVAEEMAEYLGPGEESAKALGVALTQKALALAGLGRHDDAVWAWQTVLNIYPAFARSDLSAFGESGRFLKSHVELERPDLSERLIPLSSEPKLIKEIQPKYPFGAQGFNGTGYVIVEAVITKSGMVSSPQVVAALSNPALTYAALEALHRWRYEPGIRRGQAVDVPLRVTVHFQMKTN
jgi:TonB family protein